MILILSLMIGVVAGLRAMTAPAAVSWAAYLGLLPLSDTVLAFLGHSAAPYVLSVLALGELIADKLPRTPSRRVPVQFGTRIVTGALAGAAIGAAGGMLIVGFIAGLGGAVIGTLAGAAGRARLAQALRRDLPAALIEDAVAVGGALLVLSTLR